MTEQTTFVEPSQISFGLAPDPQPSQADASLIIKQAEAQFALSPIGQMVKQFEIVQKMGEYYSSSDIVPDIYKNRVKKYDKATKQWLEVPNPCGAANCAIAIDMAIRMSLPPVMVMQNLYVVGGNPAWSSKFLIGCINSCGRFLPLEYEIRCSSKGLKGDDFAVRAVGYVREDKKKEHPIRGTWITWPMVRAEGWDQKNGSKWLTMPEQMFRYRAAAFWQRAYAPEISMGLPTYEEVMDTRTVEDVQATEVQPERIAAPKKPEIDKKRRDAAIIQLYKTLDAAGVKSVRDTFIDIYEADANFRQEVIDRMNVFAASRPLPEPAAADQPQDAPLPEPAQPAAAGDISTNQTEQ